MKKLNIKQLHELAATYLKVTPTSDYDDVKSQYTCDCLMFACDKVDDDPFDYIHNLWRECGMQRFGYTTFLHIPEDKRQEARFDWLMLMANVLEDEKL